LARRGKRWGKANSKTQRQMPVVIEKWGDTLRAGVGEERPRPSRARVIVGDLSTEKKMWRF